MAAIVVGAGNQMLVESCHGATVRVAKLAGMNFWVFFGHDGVVALILAAEIDTGHIPVIIG